MRLIKMADRSEYGWAVVAEYEADELAVDSDDEKRIYRAEKEAEKKWLKKRKRQLGRPGGRRARRNWNYATPCYRQRWCVTQGRSMFWMW